MKLPSGLKLILPHAIALAALPASVMFIMEWFPSLNAFVPFWARISLALALVPVTLKLRTLWFDVINYRHMINLGGSPIPRLPSSFGSPNPKDYFFEFRRRAIKSKGYTHMSTRFGQNMFFTSEPENVKAILATDFPNFVKGDFFRSAADSVLGTGVFNSDDEMWKFHRTMTRPFFTKDRVTDFDVFVRHSDAALDKISARVAEKVPFNFEDLIARFTLDSSSEFLFGQSVDSMHADLAYPHNYTPPFGYERKKMPSDDFVEAFEEAKSVVMQRFRLGGFWPLKELFSDSSRNCMRVIDTYIDPILQRALQRKRIMKGAPSNDDAATLLDHLVSYTDDQKVIKDEIMNIMVAGRDTTMSTLTFAVYLLSQHPDVFSRLRNEILEKFSGNENPTFDELRDLKYLRAVLNGASNRGYKTYTEYATETLRLFPPVPGNSRQNLEGMLLPSIDPKTGKHHYLPPKSLIFYSVYIMHRREDLWGPDAEQFDPDRFLDERLNKYLTPNPFIFLPFNAGPRICLGQQFAYNEMSFFLVKLLQRFSSITFVEDAQPPESRPRPEWLGRKGVEKIWPAAFMTLFVKGGLWVTMTEADSSISRPSRSDSQET